MIKCGFFGRSSPDFVLPSTFLFYNLSINFYVSDWIWFFFHLVLFFCSVAATAAMVLPSDLLRDIIWTKQHDRNECYDEKEYDNLWIVNTQQRTHIHSKTTIRMRMNVTKLSVLYFSGFLYSFFQSEDIVSSSIWYRKYSFWEKLNLSKSYAVFVR